MNKGFSVFLIVFFLIICFMYAWMNRYEVEYYSEKSRVTRYDRWTGKLVIVPFKPIWDDRIDWITLEKPLF